MKPWPENDDTVPFHEIVGDFERMLRESYRLQRRSRRVPAYDGYERFEAGLSAGSVQDTLRNTDRPMVTRILEALAGVAIEQGYRIGYRAGYRRGAEGVLLDERG